MKKIQRRQRTQNNDYYRGARDAENNREPASGHARMSRANMDYMAGFNDKHSEIRHGR